MPNLNKNWIPQAPHVKTFLGFRSLYLQIGELASPNQDPATALQPTERFKVCRNRPKHLAKQETYLLRTWTLVSTSAFSPKQNGMLDFSPSLEKRTTNTNMRAKVGGPKWLFMLALFEPN